jgi:hypothetical protein
MAIGAGMVRGFVFCLLVSTQMVCKSDPKPSTAAPSTAAPIAPPAPAPEVQAASVGQENARSWAEYDALATKSKPALKATSDTVLARAAILPKPYLDTAVREISRQYRLRMAALITPGEATATGPDADVLVPSANAAKCRLWGSMWANEDETLAAIESLGFARIACEGKSWDVKELRSTCYLYSDELIDDEPRSTVFVWKTLDYFRAAQRTAHDEGDQAAMRYLGLVSNGASMMVANLKFFVEERGDGWLRVSNRLPDAVSGYVEPDDCHAKRRKK